MLQKGFVSAAEIDCYCVGRLFLFDLGGRVNILYVSTESTAYSVSNLIRLFVTLYDNKR